MKYKVGNYIQVSRKVFERLEGCKTSTKWLYMILNELEHQFTGEKQDFFYRSIDDLADDTELSRPVVIQSLRELERLKLIKTWQGHWKSKSGKLSVKHITAIKVLEI